MIQNGLSLPHSHYQARGYGVASTKTSDYILVLISSRSLRPIQPYEILPGSNANILGNVVAASTRYGNSVYIGKEVFTYSIQMLSYETQLDLKQQVVIKAYKHFSSKL